LFLLVIAIHFFALTEWNDSLTYAEYGGLILITIIMAWSYHETVDSALLRISLKNADKLKDRDQILYFIGLIRIIERCKSDNLLYSRLGWLYAAYHNDKCNIISCPLSQLSGILDLSKDTKARKLLMIKQGIAVHFKQIASAPNVSVDLKILYIAYLSRYLKSYVGAWFMIDGLLEKDCSFVQNFHIYIFKYFFYSVVVIKEKT